MIALGGSDGEDNLLAHSCGRPVGGDGAVLNAVGNEHFVLLQLEGGGDGDVLGRHGEGISTIVVGNGNLGLRGHGHVAHRHVAHLIARIGVCEESHFFANSGGCLVLGHLDGAVLGLGHDDVVRNLLEGGFDQNTVVGERHVEFVHTVLVGGDGAGCIAFATRIPCVDHLFHLIALGGSDGEDNLLVHSCGRPVGGDGAVLNVVRDFYFELLQLEGGKHIDVGGRHYEGVKQVVDFGDVYLRLGRHGHIAGGHIAHLVAQYGCKFNVHGLALLGLGGAEGGVTVLGIGCRVERHGVGRSLAERCTDLHVDRISGHYKCVIRFECWVGGFDTTDFDVFGYADACRALRRPGIDDFAHHDVGLMDAVALVGGDGDSHHFPCGRCGRREGHLPVLGLDDGHRLRCPCRSHATEEHGHQHEKFFSFLHSVVSC